MKHLFLSSSFKDVATLFAASTKGELKGKTVTFIPTASIPEKVTFYVRAGKKALEGLGLIIDELEVSEAAAEDIADKLEKNEIIYVTGGNTFFLLQELRRKGADKMLLEQINKGKTYIGESAGAMIVSPDITYVQGMDDCKKAPELGSMSALNAVDFYPVPHHTNFPFAKAVEKIIAKYQSELSLYPISNAQAILVNGEEVRIVGEE